MGEVLAFVPEQYQPEVYKNGKTWTEIEATQRERRLDRVLGGRLRDTEFGPGILDTKLDTKQETHRRKGKRVGC